LGIFGGFSYYRLVMVSFNIVPLIMEITVERKHRDVEVIRRRQEDVLT
jgi:hypothetical protein